MSIEVAVRYATRRPWAPAPVSLRRWAEAAASSARARGELAIRVVGSAEGRRLNRGYRGKDKATNVLSFVPGPVPSRIARPLGDLVICAPVVAREAKEQGKALRAHWAHMVVHGVLHLAGHDHEQDAEAQAMESLERRILDRLGFPDPYEA
ncbi:MAG: rRNA maturation RNase YbeY [Steroidobacteraceae bacterium]|nr:rRNA maturation RNase YbeY [Steroidobacteraceae bacterium]